MPNLTLDAPAALATITVTAPVITVVTCPVCHDTDVPPAETRQCPACRLDVCDSYGLTGCLSECVNPGHDHVGQLVCDTCYGTANCLSEGAASAYDDINYDDTREW